MVAWVALGAALAAGEYAYYARHFLTEALLLPVFTAHLVALVGVVRGRWMEAVAAGLLLGAAAMIRPVNGYLFLADLLVLAFVLAWRRPLSARRAAGLAVAFAAGCVVVTAPWMTRNALALGRFALTDGYAGAILAQRVAFNAMTGAEWLMAWVYWLPDFGDRLATAWFGAGAVEQLDLGAENGFYLTGNHVLLPETRAAAGAEGHLGYLLHNYVLKEPAWHLAVTLPLAWRGLWVAKYWGLVAFLCFVPAAVAAARTRNVLFLVVSAPAWFLLGLNAFASVNVVRYNLVLIPCLSLSTAWAAAAVAGAVARRRRMARESSGQP